MSQQPHAHGKGAIPKKKGDLTTLLLQTEYGLAMAKLSESLQFNWQSALLGGKSNCDRIYHDLELLGEPEA